MEELLSFAVSLLSVAVTLWIGWILLRSGVRSGHLEERLLGVALFVGFGIGSVFWIVASLLSGHALEAAATSMAHCTDSIAGICMYEFARRVFRPHSRFALICSLVGIMCLVVSCAGAILDALAGQSVLDAMADRGSQWFLVDGITTSIYVNHFALIAAIAWAGAESLRWWNRTRRQMKFGLAEPALVHRFGYWALFNALLLAGWVADSFAADFTSSWAGMVSALMLAGGAFALWKAFSRPLSAEEPAEATA